MFCFCIFYRLQPGALGVMPACCSFVSLLGEVKLALGRAAGQVTQMFVGMKAGLFGVLLAKVLLEDWALDLKTKK